MLVFDDVSKRYGDVIALDGATFEVERARILGFLGPNGAGKTTAMRCVFGLTDPDAGSIEWDARPVTSSDRTRFGYMPEERGLYPKMRVREQLAYFARLSGANSHDAETAADRWLGRFGLAARGRAKVEELSHGNQQRLQLAVTLVHDPALLVLDEPFAGLDPLGIDALALVLREVADRGVAVVFSSHQLDLVEDLCQDVAIIDRGKIVLTGDLAGLRASARSRRLDVMVDGKHWAPTRSRAIGPAGDSGRCVVDRDVELEQLLAEAQNAGHVDRFSFSLPSLSDLFREAVTR